MDDRIPTELWVMAHVRQCTARGQPVYILHKGAYAGGTVIVRVATDMRHCRLYNQMRDLDGNTGWMDIFDGAAEGAQKADEYIARARARDPDVWVVEVEDASGANPFEGKVL